MIDIYITETLNNGSDYLNLLSQESTNRISAYSSKKSQAQMVTGDLLLKTALKKEGFQNIKVVYTPKLMLEGNPCYISKSHSFNYVMVVIANENIGCDIELIRSVDIKKRVLSDSELDKLNEMENKEVGFMRYWTAKEAYIKYHGGLIKPYKDIEFKIAHQEASIWYGTIDDLYCYQMAFNGYVISTITKSVKHINFNYITKEELIK